MHAVVIPRYLGTIGLPPAFLSLLLVESLPAIESHQEPRLSARGDADRRNSAEGGTSPSEHERNSRETWTLAADHRKKSAAHADHPGRVICSVMSPAGSGAGGGRVTAAASTCEFGRDMTLSPVSSRR